MNPFPDRFTPLQGRNYRLEAAVGWILANSF